MKKLLSIALLPCLMFSMSSFTPQPKHHRIDVHKAIQLNFPMSGQTFGKQGTLAYTITGNGSTPFDVQFFFNGVRLGGTYHFNTTPQSNGVYTATGMLDATGISGVVVTVFSGGTDGNIDFISKF